MGPVIALLAKALLSGNKEKKEKNTLPKNKVYNNAFTGLEFDEDFAQDVDHLEEM